MQAAGLSLFGLSAGRPAQGPKPTGPSSSIEGKKLSPAESLMPPKPFACYEPALKELRPCDSATVYETYGPLKEPKTQAKEFLAQAVEVDADIELWKELIPYLDPYSIDDFRSSKALLSVAESKSLYNLMEEKGELFILYPGSGSHIAPLAIIMNAIDRRKIVSGKLVCTEIVAHAEGRLKQYLILMLRLGIIKELKQARTRSFKAGHETTFSFQYHGKEISLVFILNGGGGKYWARDEEIKASDMVVFHDSFYNLGPGGEDTNENAWEADEFVEHLAELSDTDGRERFLITDQQKGWEHLSQFRYAIGRTELSIARETEGSYGCNHQYWTTLSLPVYVIDKNRIVRGKHRPIYLTQVREALEGISEENLTRLKKLIFWDEKEPGNLENKLFWDEGEFYVKHQRLESKQEFLITYFCEQEEGARRIRDLSEEELDETIKKTLYGRINLELLGWSPGIFYNKLAGTLGKAVNQGIINEQQKKALEQIIREAVALQPTGKMLHHREKRNVLLLKYRPWWKIGLALSSIVGMVPVLAFAFLIAYFQDMKAGTRRNTSS